MDLLNEFHAYKGIISAYFKLTMPGYEYGGLKDYVESFSIQLKNTIDTVRKQDRDRNLFTMEKAPASLI